MAECGKTALGGGRRTISVIWVRDGIQRRWLEARAAALRGEPHRAQSGQYWQGESNPRLISGHGTSHFRKAAES